MLHRIPPSVAFLLSLLLHTVAIVPGLWLIRAPAPVPLPLTVDLPPLPVKEAPTELVSTQPEAAPLPEPPAAARPPPPVNNDETKKAPKLVSGRALEKAQAMLSRHLFYPPEAISQGVEGEVILLLMLDATGRVTSAEIARSSGHTILDQAALTAARQIGALPGNPKQTLLPVRFRLD